MYKCCRLSQIGSLKIWNILINFYEHPNIYISIYTHTFSLNFNLILGSKTIIIFTVKTSDVIV